MLFEAEVGVSSKSVWIRNQSTQKIPYFMLHVAFPSRATQARGARATFAGLHASPGLIALAEPVHQIRAVN
jgi:hypothetical protein